MSSTSERTGTLTLSVPIHAEELQYLSPHEFVAESQEEAAWEIMILALSDSPPPFPKGSWFRMALNVRRRRQVEDSEANSDDFGAAGAAVNQDAGFGES